jgi:hypothetical protein
MARFFSRLLFLVAIAFGCMVPICLFIDPVGGMSAGFLALTCCFALASADLGKAKAK